MGGRDLASIYRELLGKLEEMASYDGFVSTLIDIRDSMIFYDRDLMLAGYTGALEGLIIASLAAACLEGDDAVEESFAAVRKVVDEFPQRLTDPTAPIDVQAVAEAFLRVGGWMLRERVSAYILAFSRYVHGDYDMDASVDVLVGGAQELAERDPQAALDRVGEVGALMLRGRPLRPRWAEVVEGRLQLWLMGLRYMVAHLASIYPEFPWGPVEEQRRRRPEPGAVVDLEAFRRRRLLLREGWQPPAQGRAADPVDALVERVFHGPAALDRETLVALERAAEEVVPLLAGVVRSRQLLEGPVAEPGAVVAAIRALAHLRRHEVVARLVELATDPGAPREVALEARAALERLGHLAVDGVREYLHRTPSVQAGAALAKLLVRMPRSDETFGVLVELFQRLRWEDDGKLAVAAALAEYGDGRAVDVLRQALRDPQLPAGRVRRELQSAVRRLTAAGRRQRTSRRRRMAR